MQYHQFRAMNTIILMEAEGPEAGLAFKLAQSFIEKSEERFTRFSETSELTALNRSAGKWFSASTEMIDLMLDALYCYEVTKGLFDPSILPDLRAAGYTRSIDQLYLYGADANPIDHSRQAMPPFSAIEVDRANDQIRLPEGMQIDLGGIAKGWIAEKAAQLMTTYTSVCAVNAGGDMYLIGHPQGQMTWEIMLEDPRDPTQDLMMLLVEKGAIATSSVTKRVWQQGEIERHHLIDPRNGEPAETLWLSVTAFAPKAILAEAFAKAIMLAGPIQSKTLLVQNPDISFLAVDSQGHIWKSPTEKERINEYA